MTGSSLNLFQCTVMNFATSNFACKTEVLEVLLGITVSLQRNFTWSVPLGEEENKPKCSYVTNISFLGDSIFHLLTLFVRKGVERNGRTFW